MKFLSNSPICHLTANTFPQLPLPRYHVWIGNMTLTNLKFYQYVNPILLEFSPAYCQCQQRTSLPWTGGTHSTQVWPHRQWHQQELLTANRVARACPQVPLQVFPSFVFSAHTQKTTRNRESLDKSASCQKISSKLVAIQQNLITKPFQTSWEHFVFLICPSASLKIFLPLNIKVL